MIRVLVVDDDALVRSGLTLMLGGAGDVEVVGEQADGTGVVAAVERLDPDVVLMDLRMPGLDGIATTRALTARDGDRPAVVVLTTFDTDDQVLGALRAGAAGYLLKHTPPGQIVDAVRRAAAGEPVLSPGITRSVIALASTRAPAGPARSRLDRLTGREREVARAVADGLSNAEIATRLYLSVGSVKTHLSAALAKLDLTNRVQLAILAHEAGAGEPDGDGYPTRAAGPGQST